MSLANSDFAYSKNCDEIVNFYFFKPEGDSFLNFGLTNDKHAFEYNRKIKEACKPNHLKPWSEHDHCVLDIKHMPLIIQLHYIIIITERSTKRKSNEHKMVWLKELKK